MPSISGRAEPMRALVSRQIGYGIGELPPVRRLFASGGYRLTQYSDLGFAYSDNVYREVDRVRVATINASTRVSRGWYLSTAFSRILPAIPSNSTVDVLGLER